MNSRNIINPTFFIRFVTRTSNFLGLNINPYVLPLVPRSYRSSASLHQLLIRILYVQGWFVAHSTPILNFDLIDFGLSHKKQFTMSYYGWDGQRVCRLKRNTSTHSFPVKNVFKLISQYRDKKSNNINQVTIPNDQLGYLLFW